MRLCFFISTVTPPSLCCDVWHQHWILESDTISAFEFVKTLILVFCRILILYLKPSHKQIFWWWSLQFKGRIVSMMCTEQDISQYKNTLVIAIWWSNYVMQTLFWDDLKHMQHFCKTIFQQYVCKKLKPGFYTGCSLTFNIWLESTRCLFVSLLKDS